MNWQNFKNTLTANGTAALQFEYQAGQLVDPAYHITEIKQAQITSVDCGGKMNAWTEVVVQLWVPEGKEEKQAMSAEKAMKIINLVEKSLSIHPDAPVKIEYGDAAFPTRQLLVEQIGLEQGELKVSLQSDITQCKANDRGEECAPKSKPVIQLASIGGSSVEGESCSPGSGCC